MRIKAIHEAEFAGEKSRKEVEVQYEDGFYCNDGFSKEEVNKTEQDLVMGRIQTLFEALRPKTEGGGTLLECWLASCSVVYDTEEEARNNSRANFQPIKLRQVV